jgi:hypothetical protein
MPRKVKAAAKRAGSAITRTARKVAIKLNPRKRAVAKSAKAPATAKAPVRKAARPGITAPKAATPHNPPRARATRRTSDVPLDLLADVYTPSQTSLHGSFRSDGADQQNDQEVPFAAGDGFENEDHFTNKSGDTRIGMHGRTNEPGEARPANRR